MQNMHDDHNSKVQCFLLSQKGKMSEFDSRVVLVLWQPSASC